MYKIGIIQHSSGAPAPTPPAGWTLLDPVNWSDVTHFTVNDDFIYSTQRIRSTAAGSTFNIYYDDGGGKYELYIKVDLAVPTPYDPDRDPIYHGFGYLPPPIPLNPGDPDPGPLLYPSNCWITFGVMAGPNYNSQVDGVISTRVVVTYPYNNQVIDQFNIGIDPR